MKVLMLSGSHPDLSPSDADRSAYALFSHMRTLGGWNTHFVAGSADISMTTAQRPILRYRGRDDEYLLSLPPVDAFSLCSAQPDCSLEIIDRLLSVFRPDLVHVHDLASVGLMLLPHLKDLGIRSVVTLHGDRLVDDAAGIGSKQAGYSRRPSERLIRARIIAQCVAAADVVVAPSATVAQQHIDGGIVPADAITVLRSPFALPSEAARPSSGRASRQDTRRLMVVLDQVNNRGCDTILDAAEALAAQDTFAFPMDAFVLADDSARTKDMGSIDDRIAAASHPLNWRGRLSLDALCDAMDDYDWLILPSAEDWSAHILFQAGCRGVPVLMEEATHSRNALKSANRGWSFPQGSSRQLARTIRDLASGEIETPIIDDRTVREDDLLAKAAHVSLYQALKAMRRSAS